MLNDDFKGFLDPALYDFFPCCDIKTGMTPTGQKLLFVPSAVLQEVTKKAIQSLSFCFTKEHLNSLIQASLEIDATSNDKAVIATLLKNAVIAAKGKLPLCQDTGVANIFGIKDNGVVITGGGEAAAISRATEAVYKEKNLRFSTVCSTDFYSEYDPKNNLPAQIAIFSSSSFCSKKQKQNSPLYRLLFCAKGGGSSNKTMFFQKTKALLNPTSMEGFLKQNIKALGTAACPPYNICVVIGGLSPEANLLALKLATCGVDIAPVDAALSQKVKDIAKDTKLGCQFGGAKLCLNAKVLRLPRHAASCHASIGVSCVAHRNLKAVIGEKGFYIQKTVSSPQDLPGFQKAISFIPPTPITKITTDAGIKKTLLQLKGLDVGTKVSITGHIIVARDAAHAKWQDLLNRGQPLPEYCTKYPICYAGPCAPPQGCVIGSFGPTTAARMDIYAKTLMSKNVALVTIAKGNRSLDFIDCCKTYGGVYLGCIGGAAAFIAQNNIKEQKIIDYKELGMEAVRLLQVQDLEAFVLTDALGNDFYQMLAK